MNSVMNSVLFGNGYWANIVKEKIVELTNLVTVIDSKTDVVLGNVDIAFVCSSTASHYDVIKRCLDNGIKYLFCTKPFTGDYEKAKELFGIAEQKNICIFVDNLFLFRKEIINIQVKDMRRIFFGWNKPVIRENLFDSLLYHDLYLLLNWCGTDGWEFVMGYVLRDALYLSITNHYQRCTFDYHTDKESDEWKSNKWIIIDSYTIDLSCPQNDPLKECIVNMLQGNIDYDLSKKVTLDTLRLMSSIKKQL